MTTAAILLAAGASRRMGTPKPLLRWGRQPLIAWEYDELMRSTVDEIVIVTGSHADDVRRALGDGAKHCVFNPRWGQGRATSLAAGARVLAGSGGTHSPPAAPPGVIVIQNVDQPTRHDIIDRLVAHLRHVDAQIVQPSYRGTAGHPVVMKGALLPELAAVRDDRLGLRELVEHHPPELLPMDDEPVVRIDLDTPDTLDEGRRLLGVG